MDNKLKATHQGELEIGEVSIPCFVLENGQRVFSGRGMQSALNLGQTRGRKIPDMVGHKNFKHLITKDLELGIFSPISFTTNKGFSANGYEATSLVEVCDLLLRARKSKILPKRYKETAEQAEILTRSFAKVGIIALVDEATGYQYDREKYELQKILKAYISQELLPWQKRFPDDFYLELFRLNSWDFTVKGIKKRPGVVGRWTNTLIYEQLPKGVLDELKKKTPKNRRFHQSLTLDVGEPNLTAQINQVLTIFRLSDNMKEMWSNFKKMNNRKHGQMELDFNFDDNGATIPIDPPIEDTPPSDFDNNLKKALNFNPKEK